MRGADEAEWILAGGEGHRDERASRGLFGRNDDPAFQQVSTNPLPLDKWSHVVATFNGSESKLYVDGSLKMAATFARPVSIPTTSTAFVIGARKGGAYEFFHGSIDEVAVCSAVSRHIRVPFRGGQSFASSTVRRAA